LIKPSSNLKLKVIQDKFNDGMLLPKIPELFDTEEKVRHFFERVKYGLVLKKVKNSMVEGFWFARLCEDSSPKLSTLKITLASLMNDLRNEHTKLTG
jgi:hypothetical protein